MGVGLGVYRLLNGTYGTKSGTHCKLLSLKSKQQKSYIELLCQEQS